MTLERSLANEHRDLKGYCSRRPSCPLSNDTRCLMELQRGWKQRLSLVLMHQRDTP